MTNLSPSVRLPFQELPALVRLLVCVLYWSASCAMAESSTTGSGSVPLTQEELSWLADHPVIRLAPDPWQELLARDFPEIDLQLVADIPTGLAAVNAGGATAMVAMVANRAVAHHHIRQLGLEGLRVVGETDYVARYGLAVRGDWPMLGRILDKALLEIDPNERAEILVKGLATIPIIDRFPDATKTELPSDLPSPEEIAAEIEALESDSQLPAAIRDKALELYHLIGNRLETVRDFEANAATFRQMLDAAPAETERIRKALGLGIAAGEPSLEDPIPAEIDLAQLEQRLSKEQAELTCRRRVGRRRPADRKG